MSDPRERLRTTFEIAADRYDAARPEYPPALFDDLVSLAGARPGDRLLEIGSGTGKATRPLLERGFSVVGVELGSKLAAQARTNLGGLPFEVHVSTFETWAGPPASFDLVYAASAWHWLDPATRYEQVHRLLRPGGHLAFWIARHAFPVGFDPFFTDIMPVYDAIGEERSLEKSAVGTKPVEHGWPPPPPEQIPDDAPEIESTGLFDDVEVRRYLWEETYTAEEYIALLETFSSHILMEPEKRDRLYSEIRSRLARRASGRVRRHWYAILHVAARQAIRRDARISRT